MLYLSHGSVRFAIALVGLLGLMFAPIYVPVICMVLLAVRYPAWEVLLMGLLIDFIWLPSGTLFSPLPLFTLLGVFLVWGLEPLRAQFLL